jgi:MFS family permease
MMTAPPDASALAPLRLPLFRSVWIASLASNFGGLVQSVGAAWLMTSIAGSADMVALVQASVALPVMLLSLLAGALADSRDRRSVMLAAQGFMFAVSLTLAVVAWAGWVTPWLLLFFTFLIGCGAALNLPAWQASVGDMVPRPALPQAVALNSMGFNLARSLGPALGGAIVALAGAAAAFAVNALSYLALIVVLFRWRPERPADALPRESLGPAMLAGVRYVLLSPAVLAVLARGAVFGFGAVAVQALLPLIARGPVGGGPLTYGLLLGAFGAGAVGGALVSTRLRARLSTEGLVRAASLAFAASLAVAALAPHPALLALALPVAGTGWVLALSSFNVSVQMSTPRWVVARALSLYQMATFGGMALGSVAWGALAERATLGAALLGAAGVLALCAAMGLRLRLADPEGRDLGPLRRWSAPETAVPVDGRTGPVAVSVQWRIAPEDADAFLAAMAERRRIRRRDGAHHWSLLRDLGDPSLWVERYDVATWSDYLRLNNRQTREDAAIYERIRRLHRGPWPPEVRRLIERDPRAATTEAARTARELAAPLAEAQRLS